MRKVPFGGAHRALGVLAVQLLVIIVDCRDVDNKVSGNTAVVDYRGADNKVLVNTAAVGSKVLDNKAWGSRAVGNKVSGNTAVWGSKDEENKVWENIAAAGCRVAGSIAYFHPPFLRFPTQPSPVLPPILGDYNVFHSCGGSSHFPV